jgi:glycosyltransferase involved in cell wall biosynthesis
LDAAAPKIESMAPYDHLSTEPIGLVTQAASIRAPEVSVVLPTHNRSAQLREAIGSVLALDEVDFELIVVDDGSTDGTGSELARLNDARLTVVRLPRSFGANVARNVGIRQSRGPYVAFLDSDDVYLPGRLLQPLRLLRRAPEIGIVLSSFTTEKRTRKRLLAVPQRIYTGRELLRLVARHVLPPTTSGLTLRKDVLEAIGGFDPALKRMQDRDLVLRAAAHAKGATLAGVLWHKRWQEDGISTPQATYIAALIALVERHAIYQNEERDARDYLIARHLLALAKAMRFRQLKRDYSLAHEQLTPPPPPLPRLITRYRSSRRERHRLRQRLISGELATGSI